MLGKRGGQNLDRDLAAELGVLGSIHLAHSAGADRRDDFGRSGLIARGKRHVSDSAKFTPPQLIAVPMSRKAEFESKKRGVMESETG